MSDILRLALAEVDSIRAVADATGLEPSSLLRFAHGEQSLRLDLADKLAAYFSITCTAPQYRRSKGSRVMRTKMSAQEKVQAVYQVLQQNPGVDFDFLEIRKRTGVSKGWIDRGRALSRLPGVTRKEYAAGRVRGVRWTYNKG